MGWEFVARHAETYAVDRGRDHAHHHELWRCPPLRQPIRHASVQPKADSLAQRIQGLAVLYALRMWRVKDTVEVVRKIVSGGAHSQLRVGVGVARA
jgi:hypothetical protein